MISESQDRQNFTIQVPPTPYRSGNLVDTLLGLQHNWATGICQVEMLSAVGISQYFLVFHDGAIVYAGRSIPTPQQLVTELSLYVHIGDLATVQQFAARRTSVQCLLQAVTETGLLRWSEIARAMRRQTREVLEKLLPSIGRVSFESGIHAIDLQYGPGEEGFLIDALLLEQELRRRE